MTKKATDIVAYITLIGWLVAFFAGTKEESKFHLNQALAIWLCEVIVSIAVGIVGGIPVIGVIIRLVGGAANLVLFVFWIMGLVSACKGEEKEVPLVGGIKLLK